MQLHVGLPAFQHRRAPSHQGLFDPHAREIERAGLGATLEAFRAKMAEWRKAGSLVTRGEVDAGSVGIAAPILDPDRLGLGSVSFVVSNTKEDEGGSHCDAARGARCRGRAGDRERFEGVED
jgi:DNA-binding IclR family transcriptional regulator